jgi:surfeit locus 1 family protein
MLKRLIFAIVFGLGGMAVLLGLGVWQLQRLDWKTAILAQMQDRIDDAPVALPQTLDAARDKYLPVTATGTTGPDELHILTSVKGIGPGYRVITTLDMDGRQILLDRGYISEEAKDTPRPPTEITVKGNLHWPQDGDSFTPPPDTARNIWFARDVPAMAAALGAEPALLIVRTSSEIPAQTIPQPVTVTGIPNDHKQYAITWFSLAAVWAVMTLALLFRRKPQSTEG